MLFALKPGEITAPVETPMGWFIGTAVEKKAPEQRPLEAVRKEIAGQLFVKEKAKGFAKTEAEKALADLKAGKKLVDLFPPGKSEGGMFAAETKPEAKETGSFNSTAEDIPQLGKEPAVKKLIFDMKAAGNIEQVLKVGDTLVVAVVDERKSPSDADFETQKVQLKTEAVKGKQFEVRESFVKSLKQIGTVVTNDSAIDKIIGDS